VRNNKVERSTLGTADINSAVRMQREVFETKRDLSAKDAIFCALRAVETSYQEK